MSLLIRYQKYEIYCVPDAQALLKQGKPVDTLVPHSHVWRAGRLCRVQDVLDELQLPTLDAALHRMIKNGKAQTTTESRKAAAQEHERAVVRYIVTHYKLMGRIMSCDQVLELMQKAKFRLDPGNGKVRECLAAAKAVCRVQPLARVLTATDIAHECDVCPHEPR